MKQLLFVVLLGLIAVVAADFATGLRPVPGGVAASYRNDLRQHVINRVAELKGASSGTARREGVPGAGPYRAFYQPAYYYGYVDYYGAPYAYPFVY